MQENTWLSSGIGAYELLGEVGAGGEAVVHRARKRGSHQVIALKILRSEYRDDEDRNRHFRQGAERLAQLDHPGIVRVLEVAQPDDEPPFVCMPLLHGTSLANPATNERFRAPRAAAQLVIKLCEAVHYAHQHGVIHGDLSPSNVLIDVRGEPMLIDFLARPLQQEPRFPAAGKCNYMAPEAAAGNGDTVAADVYGLGALFHELLTGKPPIQAETFAEVASAHAEGTELSPRKHVRELDPLFDGVCRAALRRDPQRRYASASGLARDLRRVLEDWPPVHAPTSLSRRVRLWAKRNPILAVAAFAGTALLVAADVGTVLAIQSGQLQVQQDVLSINAALASAHASVVLTQFARLTEVAALAAQSPEVQEIILNPAANIKSVAIVGRLDRRDFDSIAVFDITGKIVWRFPASPDPTYLGRMFDFRTYHACVTELTRRELEGTTPLRCVSPAYRGEGTGKIEVSFAEPVRDEDNIPIGYVILSRHAGRALDDVDLKDVSGKGQITALVGHRDRDRALPLSTAAPRLTVFAHPDLLYPDEENSLSPELTRKIDRSFPSTSGPVQLNPARVRPLQEPNYNDPVLEREGATGARLAAFAPVGNTGFTVIVSTPSEDALAPYAQIKSTLSLYAVFLNAGFVILALVAWWASLRERDAWALDR